MPGCFRMESRMAIAPVTVNDQQAITKINQAIDQANLVASKAPQAAVDAVAASFAANLASEAAHAPKALRQKPQRVRLRSRVCHYRRSSTRGRAMRSIIFARRSPAETLPYCPRSILHWCGQTMQAAPYGFRVMHCWHRVFFMSWSRRDDTCHLRRPTACELAGP